MEHEGHEPDELPDLSDITFELPLDATRPFDEVQPPPEDAPIVHDEPAVFAEPEPHPPAPVNKLINPRGLSKRATAILEAFADALIPNDDELPGPSASQSGALKRLDGALAGLDAETRHHVARALTKLQWSTVASRALRPFTMLSPDGRTDAIRRALTSRSARRRQPVDLLWTICVGQYAAMPTIERSIGFDYTCAVDAPVNRAPVLQMEDVSGDHVHRCDAVVVGSGAGGAVVAKELAEAGFRVAIVEDGDAVDLSSSAGTPFERRQRLYRSAGLTRAGAIPVPLGRGVGGSTLVSAGAFTRAPDFVLERWATTFGLQGTDPASMEPLFERVERTQRVKRVGEDLLSPNDIVIRRGAQTLGATGAPALRTIEGCRGCGTCSFGCPTDANLSVRLTYLPRAQRAGAAIFANARVEQIVVEAGRAVGVVATVGDGEAPKQLRIEAPIVVLAAGAVHTPALLQRNALGTISGTLGANLRLHPAVPVIGLMDAPFSPWQGTSEGFTVDALLASHGVVIKASTGPPSAVAGPWLGADAKAALTHAEQTASALVFAADSSSGRVVAGRRGEPTMRYTLNDNDAVRLVRGVIRAAEILLAAGARAVATGVAGVGVIADRGALGEIDADDARGSWLSVIGRHPCGTARMGVDPAASVVDPHGQVHGVGGLYVADASAMPETPAVDPQLTIMALATRLAAHIAQQS